MSDLANTYLGQYQLIEAIGHGGMATVYKAYQASLDRFVAVKVLHANRDPQFAVRFKREARAIATLQHHNILPIYDYGEQDGQLYFVLQYIENAATLHDLLGVPMAPGQALRLISHVLAALEYAHARGVIHRDLKPANILLPSPNWALLADFGIAKLMNESQGLTMSGFIIGTAAYMAPEQAAGRPVDARTDLYSLGVVLYEMLTGRVPFEADTPMAVLTKHVYEAPPPPRELNPNIPPMVEALLVRAMAKDPEARYQSASEMREDVDRIAAQFERPRPPSQVTSMYRAGVAAFQRGDWDAAVEQFSQLTVMAPDYEDAAMMLSAARLAQDQSATSALRQRVIENLPAAAQADDTSKRRRISIWVSLGVLLLLLIGVGVFMFLPSAKADPAQPSDLTPTAARGLPTPAPTNTPTATPTERAGESPTAAPAIAATAAATATPTRQAATPTATGAATTRTATGTATTRTPTGTATTRTPTGTVTTRTATVTTTPTRTVVATPVGTPTRTPTASATPTRSSSTTRTPTATRTRTPLPTATATAPKPPTNTPTRTATTGPVPSTSTPTRTSTPVPPTRTSTPVPPTATNTSVPPTDTPTDVPPTDTPTDVPPTDTPTDVPPTDTPTDVPPTDTPTDVPPTDTPIPPAPSL